MPNAFVATIVGVHEELLPASWETAGINLKTMVLRRDVALAGDLVCTRNVVATIAKLHLRSGASCRTSKKLMTKTDAKHWRPFILEYSPNMLHSRVEHCRIARTV